MNKENVNFINSGFDTYSNQKLVKINREKVSNVKDNGRPYLNAYQDNLIDAMKSLTPAAFEVYMCLLFNADGFPLRFSPENIRSITGLCKDTIRKAMAQMLREGFVEEIDFYHYVFYENRNLKKNSK